MDNIIFNNQYILFNGEALCFAKPIVPIISTEDHLAEMITDGGFDNPAAWSCSAGFSVSGSRLNVADVAGGNYGGQSGIPMIAGHPYRFECDCSLTGDCRMGTGSGLWQSLTTGHLSFIHTPTNQTNILYFYDFSPTSGWIDNVSIKPIVTFGAEMVADGTFDIPAAWNCGAGWVVSGGTMNGNASGYANFYQNINVNAGRNYKVECDLDYISGNFDVNLGGNDAIIFASAGHQYAVKVPGNVANGNLYGFSYSTFQGKIDNLSVKEVHTYGQELVVNGDFNNLTGWYSVPAGFSISGGTLNNNNSTGTAQQIVAGLTVGKPYRLSYDVVSIGSAAVQIRVGWTGIGANRSAVGTYVQNLVCGTNNYIYVIPTDLNVFSIDNVSVKELLDFGVELVPDGDFSANGTWLNLGSPDYVVSGGTLNINTAGSSFIYQYRALTAGNVYKLEVSVSDYTEGSIGIYLGSNLGIQVHNAIGIKSTYFVASTDCTIYIQCWGATFKGKIDYLSIKEVL